MLRKIASNDGFSVVETVHSCRYGNRDGQIPGMGFEEKVARIGYTQPFSSHCWVMLERDIKQLTFALSDWVYPMWSL